MKTIQLTYKNIKVGLKVICVANRTNRIGLTGKIVKLLGYGLDTYYIVNWDECKYGYCRFVSLTTCNIIVDVDPNLVCKKLK